MTYEEQQQYNKLTDKQKAVYNFTKSQNPHWSHKQIMAKVGVDENLGKAIQDGKIDVTRTGQNGETIIDPSVFAEILRGSKKFLEGLGIVIESLFAAIDEALNALDDLIDAGIEYIGNKLQQFWNWLTN